MNVIPFVHEGLGNSSYLVGLDDRRALLVDPDRSVQRYLDAARAYDWNVTAVFETHLHADFVSGAHEVRDATGAKLFLPSEAHVRLPHEAVHPSRRIAFDGIAIEAIATPGHTPEHLGYVLRTAAQPPVVFSGGSLIVGGAARTDLIASDATEALTRAQFHTLKSVFNALPDETLLYPTHGGGSFCSTGSGAARTSTLGEERASNPTLAIPDEEEFVRWFPTTFPAAPAYYFRMRAFNAAGPRLRRDIPQPQYLSPIAFRDARGDALVVDVRGIDAYAVAHIPGALSIPFRDAFPVWLGWLAPEDARLLFVTGDVPLQNVIDQALLVGYEQFAGVLDGGMTAWQAAGLETRSSSLVHATAAGASLRAGAIALDIRERDEYAAGHLPDAIHVPLADLEERLDEIPEDRPIVAYCGHGERAATALSILERSGRTALINLSGGINAWRSADLPVDV